MKRKLKYGYKLTLQERLKNWTNITNTNYDSKWFNKADRIVSVVQFKLRARNFQRVDHIENTLITEVINKLKRYMFYLSQSVKGIC